MKQLMDQINKIWNIIIYGWKNTILKNNYIF